MPVQSLDSSRIRGDFEARHARQYGHYQPGGDIEIVHLGLAGIGRLKGAEPLLHEVTCAQPAPRGARAVYLGAETGFQSAPIYDGRALRPGQAIEGPALVEERNTTVLLGPGDRLEVDPSNNFSIRVAPKELAS